MLPCPRSFGSWPLASIGFSGGLFAAPGLKMPAFFGCAFLSATLVDMGRAFVLASTCSGPYGSKLIWPAAGVPATYSWPVTVPGEYIVFYYEI